MKKLNICFFLATSDLYGGAKSFLELVDGLDKSKYNFFAIIPKHFELLEKELKKRNIKYNVIYSESINDSGLIKNIIKDIITFFNLKKIEHFLKINKIDILHNNSMVNIVGCKVAKKIGIKYICHLRELLTSGLKIKIRNDNLLKECLNNSYVNVAISNFVKKKYSKITENKIIRIYDGIDCNNYLDNKKEILNNKCINIMIAGRISNNKGQLIAIKALNILNKKMKDYEFKLFCIGGTDKKEKEYMNEMLDYVKINNIKNVDFVQFTDNLYNFRKKMDINLVCSTNEALGRTTIEGMLSGALVIGNDAGATAEIIDNNKNGLLYETSENSLSDIIINAINNKESSKKIAKNGQKFALENFDKNKQAKLVSNIYDKIYNS